MPDSKPRVALVLPTSTGGIGQHVRSLAAGLGGYGYDVGVCGPQATLDQFGLADLGVPTAPVEIAAGLRPDRDLPAVLALRAVTRHADLVHAHGLRAGLVAALGRRRSRPLVVTWHNQVLAAGWRARVLEQAERVVARAADLTLCASEDLAARVHRLGGRDVRLGPVAAPPLPPVRRPAAEVRRELGAEDRPLLLSVGRLHPQKGYDVLIDAVAELRDLPRAPVVAVAGTGPAEPELRGYADQLAAPVRFLGHRTDVADLLAACDLAVVSSRWEARQLFAQEAMRAGRPLVATATGGIPGLVGDAALLVPPGDPAALADALRRVLTDPQLAARLAEQGTARAATWPTESDTLAQVAAVYGELLGVVTPAGQAAR